MKSSTRRDKSSHEEAAFGSITKELVNTKADPSILDLNGNILSTNEEKLNRSWEHFESVLHHVVSGEVADFAPTAETITPARSIPQTSPSKSEIVSANKSIPYGKAAGTDGIPADFYKSNPYMESETLQLEEACLSKAVPRNGPMVLLCKFQEKVI